MRNYKKKNWPPDPVIEAANRAETPEAEALRGILRGIFVIKNNPDLHPIYTGDENTDTILAHRKWVIEKIMHNTIHDLQQNYEPPELIWDYSTDKNKPRLKVIPGPPKQIFSNLVQNLQDPEWVSALRQCPECHNFLLSNAKWKNKFCNTKCKEKYYGHKIKEGKRKRKTTNDAMLFKCPVNFEEVTITPTDCNNANEKNIRGLFDECSTCDFKTYLNLKFRLQTLGGQTVSLTPQKEKSSKDKGE